MKIDLSTIFLVIFLVLPGLFSRRSQNAIVLRSFETQGATEELAEFVLQALAVHLILIFFFASLMTLYGEHFQGNPAFVFQLLDHTDPQAWARLHPAESVLLFGLYVTLTFLVGHLFGLASGVWRINRPFTSLLLRKVPWLRRRGVTGSLGERPIIYQVLSPEIAKDGTPSIVFVEVEMKNALGFYAGQVRQYAVVKDGEPHKLIYLIEAWFKQTRTDPYTMVEAEGLLLDLADVTIMKVDRVPVARVDTTELPDSIPAQENIPGDFDDASVTD